jgi:glycosyltransferase involved in cell wall biosynthesis
MKRLLVFAYAFNKSSQVFSHQADIIEKLSEYFDQTVVIAADVGQVERSTYSNNLKSSEKIVVIEAEINRSSKLQENVETFFKLIRQFHQVGFSSVFYFMTETSAAIFGLYFRIRGVQQVLWYAHAHMPVRLLFASLLMNRICSSTRGSIPIKQQKVVLLGQMVDTKLFVYSPKPMHDKLSLIHYGRFDESKNISLLIRLAKNLEKSRPNTKLTVIGSPSNKEAMNYQKKVLEEFEPELESGLVHLFPACKRSELPFKIVEHDIFVHAFQGSLDKSLVEATLIGIPTVTLNAEYLSEFGTWSRTQPKDFVTPEKFLEYEIGQVISLDKATLFNELEKRCEIARSKHSLDNWIRGITQVLIGK